MALCAFKIVASRRCFFLGTRRLRRITGAFGANNRRLRRVVGASRLQIVASRLDYGASRLQNSRFATVFFWGHTVYMFLRLRRRGIELEEKTASKSVSKWPRESLRDCRNYIMALRACKIVASRLFFAYWSTNIAVLFDMRHFVFLTSGQSVILSNVKVGKNDQKPSKRIY